MSRIHYQFSQGCKRKITTPHAWIPAQVCRAPAGSIQRQSASEREAAACIAIVQFQRDMTHMHTAAPPPRSVCPGERAVSTCAGARNTEGMLARTYPPAGRCGIRADPRQLH